MSSNAKVYPVNAPVQAPPRRCFDGLDCEEKAVVTIVPLLMVGIMSLICFVIYVQPSAPKIGLHSLSVSSFNISASGELTAYWDVGFLARYTDAVSQSPTLSYEHTVLSVYYKNQLLAEAVFPEFWVPLKKTESINGNAVAFGKRIDDAQVADALARDWSEGVVAFTVTLIDTSSYSGDAEHIKVICNDVKVEFSNYSSTQGKMQDSATNTDQQAFSRCTKFK